jgi:hypothetical protein
MDNINDLTKAAEALRDVGGLPVAVYGDRWINENGFFVGVATTPSAFESVIKCALKRSQVGLCYIRRVYRTD